MNKINLSKLSAKGLLFALSWQISTPLMAHEISGDIGIEGRYFNHDALFEGQSEHNASVSLNLNYYHDYDDNQQRIAFTGFARIDSEDQERTHLDARELYWWRNFNAFEVYAGVRKVFWGVTESVHLVDVINQTDSLENIDGEDKLGQPLLEFVSVKDFGTFNAYIMPYFREREFPGEESRLRAGTKILQDAVYQSDDEERHVDFALRWSHYFGPVDIGLSHFSGTSRAPIFMPEVENGNLVGLRPHYQQIAQTGIDVQATLDAWLLKLEAVSIDERDWRRSTALALGLEYTFYGIAGSNADLGVVAEYQFDDREGFRRTSTQNDIVAGVRWAFNDLDGSDLLLLGSQDLDYDNRFFSLELNRRINDDWKVEAEARIFSSIEEGTPEYDFRDDDYFQIEIHRYF